MTESMFLKAQTLIKLLAPVNVLIVTINFFLKKKLDKGQRYVMVVTICYKNP